MRAPSNILFIFTMFAVTTLVAGCRTPPPMEPTEITVAALVEIKTSFEETIFILHEDPEWDWHAGWGGNVVVNAFGGQHAGLCHHWQEAVYVGVKPTVSGVGWHAWGIALNIGRSGEHHAVLVFDPARYQLDDPLPIGREDEAYVLDGWRRGEADVYRLHDWMNIRRLSAGAPIIEDVDAILAGEESEVAASSDQVP